LNNTNDSSIERGLIETMLADMLWLAIKYILR
jgi:hypothetical protein